MLGDSTSHAWRRSCSNCSSDSVLFSSHEPSKAMLLLHNLVRPIKKKLFIFRCHDRNWELRATFASCQVMLYKVGLSCCRLSRPNRSRVEDEIRLLSLVLRAEIIWKIQLLFSHSCSVCLDKGPEGPWVFAPINIRLLFVWFFFSCAYIQ